MEEKEKDLFRLLGYYKDPTKEIIVEKPLSEEEMQLADNLKASFSKTEDPNLDRDNSFLIAVREFIFLLKDKNSRLYLYWPKTNLLLIQAEGSTMDKENLVSLALEYKSWFKPGEKIVIGLLGTANIFTQYQSLFLYDFLRTFSRPGSWIEIIPTSSNIEPIKGAIQVVGKDFVIVQTKDLRTICATNHMNILIRNSVDSSKTGYGEDVLEPMGSVLFSNPTQIIIKGNTGVIYKGKSNEALEPLKRDDKVYFTPRRGGMKGIQASFIHKAETTSYCYKLAKKKINADRVSEGEKILQHVLECFPDYQPAKDLLASLIPQSSISDRERKYNEACSKWNDGDKETAHIAFSELLNDKNSTEIDAVSEGCIKYLAKYYVDKYLESSDEDNRNIATEFIEEYFSKINESDAIDSKIELYYKLGYYQDCIDLIDFKLDDELLSGAERYRLYYYRSQNLYHLGRYDDSEKDALKSLSINPFGNFAEKRLSISDKFTLSLSRPVFDNNELYSLSLSQMAKNKQKEDAKAILQKAESWTIESTEDYSFLPFAAVLDDKNSKKYFLEYLYKKASDVYVENPESSVFIWSQIFSMVPGYGYFNHIVLVDALSTILDIDLSENEESIDGILRRKTDKSSIITGNEWRSIMISISTNQDIITIVFQSIKTDNRLMAQLKQYISTIDPTLIGGEIVGTDIVEKIIPKLEFNNREAVRRLINTIPESPSVEDITKGLISLDYVNHPFSELQPADYVILTSLYESVVPLVLDYQKESNVKEGMPILQSIVKTIDTINIEIVNRPTYFSVFGISHILELIIQSLKKRQGLYDEANLAKLSVSITTDTIFPDKKGIYTIGVLLENGKGLATAKDVVLELRSQKLSSQNKVSQDKLKINIGDIQGGRSKQGYFNVALPKEITSKPSFGFAIQYSAFCKGRPLRGLVTPLQVRFHGGVFEEITNQPYSAGTGLPYKAKTFFGRDKEVDEIVKRILSNKIISTQLIVYGQARCGKSSLLNRVQGELNSNYSESVWCVKDQLQIEIPAGKPKYDESDFFREILTIIQRELNSIPSQIKPTISIPEFDKVERPVDAFSNAIMDFKKSIKETPGWENRNLVLILDEFSAIYNRIKEGKVSDQILFHWKGIQENPHTSFTTIFIGHDTTPLFFNESYAVNAASIIERMRVSYLTKEAAKDLIEQPIMTSNGKSRFYPEAVRRIIDYTACNPFHIQQFMQSVIQYINDKRIIRVTSVDVDIIANDCLSMKDDYFGSGKDFSNLLSPGINEEFRKIKDDMYLTVLKTIANLNEQPNTEDWCKLDDVKNRLGNQIEDVDAIIQDLAVREVITKKTSIYDQTVFVRIKVLLFKLWLLTNCQPNNSKYIKY